MIEIVLQPPVAGKLFISALPGKYESIENFLEESRKNELTCVVGLISDYEIKHDSPCFCCSLKNETNLFPFQYIQYPVPGEGNPDSFCSYLKIIHDISLRLISGEHILVHCNDGKRRAPEFVKVLMADIYNQQRTIAPGLHRYKRLDNNQIIVSTQ